MNKIYKVIWSKTRNCYVAVAEFVKRNGKGGSSLNPRHIAATLSVFLGTLGLFMPWTVMAANTPPSKTAIVPVPGGATVVSKDKVHSVYPGTVVSGDKGKYGMGVYKQFDISKGNIANMYFHTQGGNVEANDLLNLVNSKININGTVNAIQDNRIGGHLYFLSKDGILVGRDGVINAGAITMATPSSKFFLGMNGDSISDSQMRSFLVRHYTDIKKLDDPTIMNPVYLNKQGSIVIEGKINTYQGTTLRAPSIEVAEAATVNNYPVNQQNEFDFSSLVNIRDEQGAITSAQLDGVEQTISLDKGSGHLLLYSYANAMNYRDKSDILIAENLGNNASRAAITVGNQAKLVNPKGLVSLTAVAVEKPTDTDRGLFGYDPDDWNLWGLLGMNVSKSMADISVDGVVNGGKVSMLASATNAYNSTAITNPHNTIGIGLSAIGSVLKSNLVTKKIPFINDVLDSNLYSIPKSALDSINASFSVVHADAKVNIGEHAIIKANGASDYNMVLNKSGQAKLDANGNVQYEQDSFGMVKGGSIQIKANSSATNVLKVLTKNKEHKPGGVNVNDYVNMSLGWTDTESNADVKIDGQVNADGNVVVGSGATINEISVMAVAPAANAKKEGNVSQSADVDIAVGVTTQRTRSDVTLGKTGVIMTPKDMYAVGFTDEKGITHEKGNAVGDVYIRANTSYSVDDNTLVAVVDGKGAIETAVRFVESEGDARAALEGQISAGNHVDVATNSRVTFNEIVADNTYGKDPALFDLAKALTGKAIDYGKDGFKNWFKARLTNSKDIADNAAPEIELDELDEEGHAIQRPAEQGDDGVKAKTKWNEYFDFGAAVTTAVQLNHADVYIGKTAQIKAEKDLKLSADATFADSYIRASSTLMDSPKSATEAMVAAGVLVNVTNNKATITVADGTSAEAGKHASLQAGGNLKVNAHMGYEYGRPYSMYKNFKDVWDQFVKDYGIVADGVEAALDALEKVVIHPPKTIEETMEAMDAVAALLTEMDKVLADVDAIKTTKAKLINMMKDIANALDPGFWVQSYTAASTRTPKKAADIAAAVTATAEVNVYNNQANVNIGKYATLQAGNELDVRANADQVNTIIAGRTRSLALPLSVMQVTGITDTTGAEFGVGGTINASYSTLRGKVDIADNAVLTARDITLKSETDLVHVGVTYGGSSTSAAGITGMVNFTGGLTDAAIAVGSGASLNATDNLTLSSNNDTIITAGVGDLSKGAASSVGASLNVLVFDDKGTVKADGATLKAGKLVANAESSGVLTNVAVAGVLSGGSKEAKGAAVVNERGADAADVAGRVQQGDDGGNSLRKKAKEAAQKIDVAAAGAAAVNAVIGETTVSLRNSDVQASVVETRAKDKNVVGAYSGAGALSVNREETTKAMFATTLSGDVAVNDITKTLTSEIAGGKVTNNQKLLNMADDLGVQIAVGTALGLETGARNTVSADIGINGSVNIINTKTAANLAADITGTSDKADVTNAAIDHAVQVTGGLNAEYAKSAISAGANIALNETAHDVEAQIKESRMTNVGALSNLALSDATQVAAAVSAGVVVPSGRSGANYFDGNAAVVLNLIQDTVQADVTGSTIEADSLQVYAGVGSVKETLEKVKVQEPESANAYLDNLADFVDVTGQGSADLAGSAADFGADPAKLDQAGTAGSIGFAMDGNNVVAGDESILSVTSTGSVDAAGNVTDTVYDSKAIELKPGTRVQVVGAMTVDAQLGKENVSATGGALVGVSAVSNKTKAVLTDNTLTIGLSDVQAVTDDVLVTVAGQAEVTKGNLAVGLIAAANDVSGSTEALLAGNSLMQSRTLDVHAQSDSDEWAVALGAAVGLAETGVALQGNVAVNTGTKHLRAEIDKTQTHDSSIENLGSISVTTEDKSGQKAIAGDVSFAKTVSAGGIVATNNIGVSDSNRQENVARIRNTRVMESGNANKQLTVRADDKSGLFGFALGGTVSAGQAGATLSGLSATGVVHKNVDAALDQVTLDRDGSAPESAAAVVEVKANNEGLIVTSADSLAFTMANVAASGAIAVTESFVNTGADVKGLKKVDGNAAYVKDMNVAAASEMDIYNVGIDAAVTVGQGGAGAGNVIVNRMENNTEATLSKSKVFSNGNVGVLANTDDAIHNFAGAGSGTFGQGYFSGGLSVAVNVLDGNTKAAVTESDISALGNADAIEVTTYTEKEGKSGEVEKSNAYRNGLVVDADAKRDIYGFVLTGALTGTAEVGIGVAGTVGVDHIGGETSALVDKTSVNAAYTTDNALPSGSHADIYVDAKDNSNINTHVASIGLGIGVGTGGGAAAGASNSAILDRTVRAAIVGSDADSSAQAMNGDLIAVNALNHSKLTSSTSVIAAGGGMYGNLELAAAISTAQYAGETVAEFADIDSVNNGLTVEAGRVVNTGQYCNEVQLGGSIGGASASVGFVYVGDGSSTTATLRDSTVQHRADKTAKDGIRAKNNSRLIAELADGALEVTIGGSVAPLVGINNLDHFVGASVENATIGTETKRAQSVAVQADNKVDADFVQVDATASLLGLGVAVDVTTLNSSTVANVGSANLYADDITVEAQEDRDVKVTEVSATVGGDAVNTNVAVLTMGSAVQDKYVKGYMYSEKDATELKDGTAIYDMAPLDKLVGDSFKVQSEDRQKLVAHYVPGLVTDADMDDGLKDYGTVSGKGGSNNGLSEESRGVKANVKESTLDAVGKVNIASQTKVKADLSESTVSLSAGNVNVGVGVINVEERSGVNITNSQINGRDTTISADADGSLKNLIDQPVVSGLVANVGVSDVYRKGKNAITMSGATVRGTEALSVSATDTTALESQIVGANVVINSLSVLLGYADDDSNTGVQIADSSLYTDGTLAVDTGKKNYVYTTTVRGSAAMGEGGVLWADATTGHATHQFVDDGHGDNKNFTFQVDADKGQSTVQVSGKSSLTGKTVALNAVNASAARAQIVNVGISVEGEFGYAKATAETAGGAAVITAGNTRFKTDMLQAAATVETQTQKGKTIANAQTDVTGVFAGLIGTISIHEANARTLMGAETSLGAAQLAAYSNAAGADVDITAATGAVVSGNTNGFDFSLLAESGTNKTYTLDASRANAKFNTGNAGSGGVTLHDLTLTSRTDDSVDAYANGIGGSLALTISPEAAYVNSKENLAADATLSGTMNLTGALKVDAGNNINTRARAAAVQAALLKGSGTEGYSDIAARSGIKLDGAKITTAGKARLAADNTFAFLQRVDGNGFGGIDVQVSKLYNDIVADSQIDLKNNSTLQSAGDMVLSANMGNDMDGGFDGAVDGGIESNGYAYIGGLVFSDANVVVHDNVKVANSVTVDNNSVLRTTAQGQDITLSAAENYLTMRTHALSENDFSASGVATTRLKDVVEYQNDIKVGGNIYGMHDVNLYADKTAMGSLSSLLMDTTSEAYNRSIIPFSTSPKLEYTINQENKVDIAHGAEVQSIRNMDLFADKGSHNVYSRAGAYRLYNSDVVSGSSGAITPTYGGQNKVIVDGKAVAGVGNKVTMTIGDEGDLVFVDSEELAAVKAHAANSGRKVTDGAGAKVVVDADGTSLTRNDLVFGTIDYANTLYQRYQELDTLIAEYSDDKGSAVYQGYLAEWNRIAALMKKQGMMDADGNVKYVTKDGERMVAQQLIDYVRLPDIVAAGGNVTISTDALQGKGTITAQGTPEVKITNNTNLLLAVGNISIEGSGGEVVYNGEALPSADADTSANRPKIESVTSKQGEINILGNYNGQDVHFKLEDDQTDYTMTPTADILIGGLVDSHDGKVVITSARNNVEVHAIEENGLAGVQGREVNISAAHGTVNQGTIEGIVNIGGDPVQLYDSAYRHAKENEITYNPGTEVSNLPIVPQNGGTAASGTMIAGGSIYINATDINLNGYVQSGYAKYEVTIDNATRNKIDELNTRYAGTTWTDAQVVGNSAFRLVEAKDVWNEDTQSYHRQEAAYYNPTTQRIVVPDIDNAGGNIYLTGRISSTGNGRIVCLDGAYDITVNSAVSGVDLQVGKLLSNQVEGKVVLHDTSLGSITTVTRNGSVVTDEAGNTINNGTYISTDGAGNRAYNPQEGLRYNWSTGENKTTRVEYSKETMRRLWGGGKEREEDYDEILTEWETDPDTIKTPVDGDSHDKLSGAYIGGLDLNSEDQDKLDNDFLVVFNNSVLSYYKSDVKEEQWSTGLFNCHHHYRYTWYTETGSAQSYLGSVKADKPIAISFIGNSDGTSNINVNGQKNVVLTGSVGDIEFKGNVSVNSANAGIMQTGGYVQGKQVTLTAAGSITGQDGNSALALLAKDSLGLTAENTGSGTGIKTLLKVDRAYGEQGSVTLQRIGSGNAELTSVTAEGTLLSDPNGVVQGHNLYLESMYGKLDNVRIQGGQEADDRVDAKASGDISLVQTAGDLCVGKVESKTGNVTLTATNGAIVDNLPQVELDNRNKLEERLSAMGMLALDGVADELRAMKQAALDKIPDADKLDPAYKNYKDWDLNKILYAIEESKINPKAGVMDSGKDPNVLGHTITLNAGTDIGAQGTDIKTIQISELGSADNDYANLKALALADPLSVTWGDNTVTIQDKYSVGVQTRASSDVVSANAGTYATAGGGSIYLQGRKLQDGTVSNTDLTINAINTAKDVVITSLGSLTSAQGASGIQANNLDVRTGGNIGSAVDIDQLDTATPLLTDLTGTLTATAVGDIAIYQNSDEDLTVKAVSATGNVYVHAKKNITMPAWNDSTLVQSYIRSEEEGNIVLKSDEGSLGTSEARLRFVNMDAAPVDKRVDGTHVLKRTLSLLAPGGDVYVLGLSSSSLPAAAGRTVRDAQGTLYLYNVDAKDVLDVSVNGSLNLMNGESVSTEQQINLRTTTDMAMSQQLTSNVITLASTGKIDVNDGTVLTAVQKGGNNGSISIKSTEDDVNLNGGNIISEQGTLRIESEEKDIHINKIDLDVQTATLVAGGRITQEDTDGAALTMKAGQTLDSQAVTGISLMGKRNDLATVALKNTGAGDVILVNGGNKNLNVSVAGDNNNIVNGGVTIRNVVGGSENDLLVTSAVNAAGKVWIANEEGGLALTTTDRDITGSDITLYARDNVVNSMTLTVNNGILRLESAEGNVTNTGTLGANGTNGSGSVELVADKGTIVNNNGITATGHVLLSSKENIEVTADKNINAGTYVKIVSQAGSVSVANAGGITAANGSVTLDGKSGVTNRGNITATAGDGAENRGISLHADNGAVTNEGRLDATQGDVVLLGKGSVSNNGNIIVRSGDDPSHKISLQSLEGNVINTGTDGKGVLAAGSIVDGVLAEGSGSIELIAENGAVQNDKALAATGDVTVISRSQIVNDKGILAGRNVTLQSLDGSINNNATLKARDAVTLYASQDIVNADTNAGTGSISAGTDVDLTAENGSITNTSAFNVTGNVSMTAGSAITTQGSINAQDVTLKAGTTLKSGGDISGSTENGHKVVLEAGQALTNNSTVTDDVVTITGTVTGDVVTITADQGDLTNKKAITGSSVTVTVKDGSITNEANVTATNGKVTLDAKSGVTNMAGTITGSSVTVTVKDGLISNMANVTATNGKVTLDSKSGVTNIGNITATADDGAESRGISLYADDGAVTNSGTLDATQGDVVLLGEASVINTGNIVVNSGNVVSHKISLQSLEGDVINKDDGVLAAGGIESGVSVESSGSIELIAEKGAVLNDKALAATGDVTVISNSEIVNIKDIVAGGNVSLQSLKKNILLKEGIIRGDSLVLAAEEGTVRQEAASQVLAADVEVTAANGIRLMSGAENTNAPIYNEFVDLTVKNTNGGTVALGNGLGNGLDNGLGNGERRIWTVTFAEGSQAETVVVHNFDDIANDTSTDNDMVLKGSVAVTGELSVQNDEGDLTGTMNATVGGNVLFSATGELTNSGGIVSKEGSVTLNGKTGVENSGALSGKTGISEISAEGNVINKADVVSEEGSVTLNGKTGVTNTANLTGTAVSETAATGDISNAAGTTIVATTVGVTMTATSGGITSGAAVTSAQAVNMDAQGDIQNSGALQGDDGVTLQSGNSIKNTGRVKSLGPVSIEAAGSLSNWGTVTAVDGVTLDSGALLLNHGNVLSTGGSILLEGKEGVDNMANSLIAATNVEVKSDDGSVYNLSTKRIVAMNGDVLMTAADSIMSDAAVTSGGEVAMKANDALTNAGNITAKDAVLLDSEDKLTNSGDIASDEGSVTLDGNKGIENSGSLRGISVSETAATGDISNASGTTIVATTGGVEMTATSGGITSGSAVISAQAVNMEAQDDIQNSGALQSNDAVTLQSGKSIDNSGAIVTKGAATLTAGTNLKNTAAVTSGGAVAMTANGVLTNAGNITGKDAVLLDSEDKLTNSGDIASEEGTVTLSGKAGVALDGGVVSGSSLTLQAVQGAITQAAGSQVKAASTQATAAHGISLMSGAENTNAPIYNEFENLTVQNTNGEMVALGNGGSKTWTVTFEEGSKATTVTARNFGKAATDENAGNAMVVNGSVDVTDALTLQNDKGDLTVTDVLQAGGDVNLNAGGALNVNGNVQAGGNILESAGGNVNIQGNTEAGKSVSITNQQGSLTVDGNILAKTGEILLQAGDINYADKITAGALTMNGELLTQQPGQNGNITVYNTNGPISIEKATVLGESLLRIYADKGDITTGELDSVKGAVDVGASNGNVKVESIDAEWMAGIGTKIGNIDAGTLKGNAVVMYTKDPDAVLNAQSIQPKKYVALQGNHFAEGLFDRIEGNKGILLMDISGANINDTIENLNLNVTDGNRLNLRNLAVESADINVIDGSLVVDNLRVGNKAVFRYKGYTTSVYGRSPHHDGSDSIYYSPIRKDGSDGDGDDDKNPSLAVDLSRLFFGYDDKQNIIEEIREQVEMLDPIVSSYDGRYSGGTVSSNPINESFKTGMYLRFDSGRVQTSNGLLLHLGDGYYVYPQRWSAEALHEKLSDFKASDVYRALYRPDIKLYWRGNVLEDERDEKPERIPYFPGEKTKTRARQMDKA